MKFNYRQFIPSIGIIVISIVFMFIWGANTGNIIYLFFGCLLFGFSIMQSRTK